MTTDNTAVSCCDRGNCPRQNPPRNPLYWFPDLTVLYAGISHWNIYHVVSDNVIKPPTIPHQRSKPVAIAPLLAHKNTDLQFSSPTRYSIEAHPPNLYKGWMPPESGFHDINSSFNVSWYTVRYPLTLFTATNLSLQLPTEIWEQVIDCLAYYNGLKPWHSQIYFITWSLITLIGIRSS